MDSPHATAPSGGGSGGADLVVVGGGVIGLSIAWRAAREGRGVIVIDPAPGSGASHAAAGMLAPVSEVTYTEEPLLRLGLASLARWPAFAAELSEEAGMDVDHRTDGTLDVAFTADDLVALEEMAGFLEKLSLPVERLTGRECRRAEPMLAPGVRGGILASGDAWVDPRRVTAALLAALARRGVQIVTDRVTGLVTTDRTVTGVRCASGATFWAGLVVLAAGAWSGSLDGLPPEALPPVRPVKGQIMRLRGAPGLLTRCVRGMVHGSRAYLVPRGDGEIVLGATQEEMGFDTRVTAGALWELLRDARELVPGITELEVADVSAGLRPGTPDNLPVIGPSGLDGLVLATGHHRGGVLLAPLTADLATAAFGPGPARSMERTTPAERAEPAKPTWPAQPADHAWPDGLAPLAALCAPSRFS
ncbi:glycine oxidase ThiO [Sphaerisporangium melleum]|uniref:glycine oxidase n=1 Tax=Sphaerisporangium melleum TaxID=321316 RepID=A0A917RJD7_9ACTN|nr:glycine oxidase ThiO [Sphaerisporangium melleum]GGL09329.1 glycine oxidase ThiO [Sphaerisporangium melleum]GII67552.1 glycine oxidase ThiO [Sphaerisporangium melleum]